MEEPTEIHRNLMPEKRQERKTRCGTNGSICGTLERTGKGCPFPKTCFWTYHLHGVTDASLDLCNVQPNAKVLTDGTGCNGSAPGGKGGSGFLLCQLGKLLRLSELVFLSETEIIINIAADSGMWWWSKGKNTGPPWQSCGACYLDLCSLPIYTFKTQGQLQRHGQVFDWTRYPQSKLWIP